MKFDINYANIIDEKTLHKEIYKVLSHMSEAFTNTLGPYGNNTIIEDRYLRHTITKDGYTVFKNILFYEKIPKVISFIIQKVSGILNEIVGDGTTSAVVTAKENYGLRDLIKKYNISPRIISTALEIIVEQIVAIIKERSVKINNIKDKTKLAEVIKNIAAIACNNDYKKGKIISELFMTLESPETGFINVEISKGPETYFDKERGFEIYRGLLIPEMYTEGDNYTAIWSDPRYLLIEGQVMSNDVKGIFEILNYTASAGIPLVIIAGGFSKVFEETLRKNIFEYYEKEGKKLPIICVTVDTDSELGKEGFYDIEANVGARSVKVLPGRDFPVMTPDVFWNMLGNSEKIISNGRSTKIIKGKLNVERIKSRMDELDKRIEFMQTKIHEVHDMEIYKLKKRKAILNNDMLTLYVGGDTYEERETAKYLVIDAVHSCKAAYTSGIVTGGNTIVAKIINDIILSSNNAGPKMEFLCNVKDKLINSIGELDFRIIDKVIIDICKTLYNSYINVYTKILNNKFKNKFKSKSLAKKAIRNNSIYNLMTNKFEKDIEETGIENMQCKVINPSETDIKILVASTSIINLLITSNQFIRVPQIEKVQKEL